VAGLRGDDVVAPLAEVSRAQELVSPVVHAHRDPGILERVLSALEEDADRIDDPLLELDP
jgi:hypothetical protein